MTCAWQTKLCKLKLKTSQTQCNRKQLFIIFVNTFRKLIKRSLLRKRRVSMVSSNSKFWKLPAIDFLLRKHWWLHWTRLHRPENVPYLRNGALTKYINILCTHAISCNIIFAHLRLVNIIAFKYVQSVYYANLDKTILDAMEHQWNHVINYRRPWTKTQSRCCKAKLEEAKALLPFSLCVESTHQSCARDGVRNHKISPPEEWMNRQLPRIAFVTCIDGAR